MIHSRRSGGICGVLIDTGLIKSIPFMRDIVIHLGFLVEQESRKVIGKWNAELGIGTPNCAYVVYQAVDNMGFILFSKSH